MNPPKTRLVKRERWRKASVATGIAVGILSTILVELIVWAMRHLR
jgi:hypothetical protein